MTAGVLADLDAPSGWTWRQLWTVAPRVVEKGCGSLKPLSVFIDQGVVPRADRTDNHNSLGADLDGYLRVLPGDVVFNKLRTWQGGLGVSQDEGIVSPAYFVCRSGSRAVPRFLHYLLRSLPYLAELTRLSKWMPPSQFDIPWEALRKLPLLLPPQAKQQCIADFLDDQVALLDRAIDLRRQQSLLLEESSRSRAADVISGTSTKGPTMVRHPVLGPVSGQWPVRRIKDVVSRVGVGVVVNPSSYFADEGVPFLHGGNVRDGWFDLTNVRRISPEDSRVLHSSRLDAGDVVVVRAGYPGRATVVTDDLAGANCASVLLIKPSGAAISKWLEVFFNSPQGRSQVSLAQYGAAQEQINVRDVVEFVLTVPSVLEQRAQMQALAFDLSELRRLAALLEHQRDLLVERKQALITAAVTGQFDVTTARSVA